MDPICRTYVVRLLLDDQAISNANSVLLTTMFAIMPSRFSNPYLKACNMHCCTIALTSSRTDSTEEYRLQRMHALDAIDAEGEVNLPHM